MRIVRCTKDSDGWYAVLAHALLSFFGDNTCSADNVKKSCFGAEWCDHRMDITERHNLRALLEQNTCYVALDGYCFLGVVAVSPTGTVHHFCVTERERGRKKGDDRPGVGTQLLSHVIERHGRSRLNLTVAQPVNGHKAASEVLRQRHDRLVHFYKTFGFKYVGENDGYTHMVRRS